MDQALPPRLTRDITAETESLRSASSASNSSSKFNDDSDNESKEHESGNDAPKIKVRKSLSTESKTLTAENLNLHSRPSSAPMILQQNSTTMEAASKLYDGDLTRDSK